MINQLNSETEALANATLECKKFLMDKWKSGNDGKGLTEIGEEILSYLKFIVFKDMNISDQDAIKVLRQTHIGPSDYEPFDKFWSEK